jgi:hypothetical protein
MKSSTLDYTPPCWVQLKVSVFMIGRLHAAWKKEMNASLLPMLLAARDAPSRGDGIGVPNLEDHG